MHPEPGQNLQPRHVPYLGIELVTFCFVANAQSMSHTGQGHNETILEVFREKWHI